MNPLICLGLFFQSKIQMDAFSIQNEINMQSSPINLFPFREDMDILLKV